MAGVDIDSPKPFREFTILSNFSIALSIDIG
jgi:hypothetical protein